MGQCVLCCVNPREKFLGTAPAFNMINLDKVITDKSVHSKIMAILYYCSKIAHSGSFGYS